MTQPKAPTPLRGRLQKDLSSIRVLIADESLLANRFADFLTTKGLTTLTVRSGSEVKNAITEWKPDFVFYDLMLPELNALEFLLDHVMQSVVAKGHTKVLVLSGHNDLRNVKDCIRAGACDFISKPYKHEDLLSRLILHLSPKREAKTYAAPQKPVEKENAEYYLHLADLMLREALKGTPVADSLYNLVGLLGHSFEAVRVSVIRCEPGYRNAAVVASNDKRNVGDITLSLAKYPEIQYVMNHDKLLALDNLETDATMQFVTRLTKTIDFNAVVVAPIRIAHRFWGVLSIRLPAKRQTPLTDSELRYAQLAANAIGLTVLRDTAVLLKAPPEDPSSSAAA